jgi:dienelactone hydrolase
MRDRLTRYAAIVLLAIVIATPAKAQQRGQGGGAGVYKARITPHWFDGGTKFWYQNDLAGGKREFILVDAEQGRRKRAFDNEKLAAAISQASGVNTDAEKLPISRLEFKTEEPAVEFRAWNRQWRCDLGTYAISEAAERLAPFDLTGEALPRLDGPRVSQNGDVKIDLTLHNRTDGNVEVAWLDDSGRSHSYGEIAPGKSRTLQTYAGHVWEFLAPNRGSYGTIRVQEETSLVNIRSLSARVTDDAWRRFRSASGRSADGKWLASVKGNNVVIRALDSEKEIQLTQDGREGLAYDLLQWSPDSQALVAFRVEPGERKEVHFVESSPPAGGRAALHSRPYALPGDRVTAYEMHLFNVPELKEIECRADRIDFGRPQLRWKKDSHTFTYEQVDRGHQRLRLSEVDALTGSQRNLIDERSDTFLWTAHTESVNLRPFHWLSQSDELIYVSERDGWRHLYLVDSKEGAIKNQITKGDFVVRGIERIDEPRRQIWFRACGRNPDQDPYFIHYYRVNFDGTGLIALTAGNGTHTVQFSPDHKYVIDTYSRVDRPPIHELRRAADGQLVCKLEEGDIGELKSNGWEPPDVFTAKGRDGKTDIWGIICRPRDFDAAKKYPEIEHIYAGPHGSFVPKSFSAQRRFSSLTDLGFVVVQIDGMGTANRSKAFHDVCWKNLKDAGFPDRILWHKAVADKYAWYDISRVGIYGGSAGGQNSTAALLFHPAFYKVGVSGCGCHDNRMDKASWNEQWMGYPVGPQYAECSNIDNAALLRGKLLLIVGEMDTNVPPESTFRLADALIKAGKDFDLVVVPGAGHGMGGAYGTRRMNDFFVRHLLGQEPPDRNQ